MSEHPWIKRGPYPGPEHTGMPIPDDPVVGHATFRDGHHEPIRKSEAEAIIAASDRAKVLRAEQMPDEQSAINIMFSAWLRLKELGWREAQYCPKDGQLFDVIENGSTGIHRCRYEGEWPTGGWWIVDDDLWPSRPALFRAITDQVGQVEGSAQPGSGETTDQGAGLAAGENNTGPSTTETASDGVIVVVSQHIALRMLIDTWRDPTWWREHGAAMDSHDCADELEKVLAATTLSTEVSSTTAASSAQKESLPPASAHPRSEMGLNCHVCGKPASCIGRYEGHGDYAPACDACCGHGNEDGWCKPLAVAIAQMSKWIIAAEDDPLANVLNQPRPLVSRVSDAASAERAGNEEKKDDQGG